MEQECSQYDVINRIASKLEQLLREKEKQPQKGNASKTKKTLIELEKQMT